MKVQPEDPVSVRRLRERDKARNDGDSLARAVDQFLRDPDASDDVLALALHKYIEAQGLNRFRLNFQVHKNPETGTLEVTYNP